MNQRQREQRRRRRLAERLWAEGVSVEEIAKRLGWHTDKPSQYITVYRRRGWNLPHRYSEERVEALRRGRWPQGGL